MVSDKLNLHPGADPELNKRVFYGHLNFRKACSIDEQVDFVLIQAPVRTYG